jgi:predicted metalloprotease with PDZ domain
MSEQADSQWSRIMARILAALFAICSLPPFAQAQHPFGHYTEAFESRFARSQPVVSYTLRVDSADLSGWNVEIRLRNLPDTFRLAMAAHPEYDDRYYRYVTGLRVEAAGREGSVTRIDSAVWRVVAPGGTSVVRYRVQLPDPSPPPRAAWRPFLSPTGGLTGGPHAFMYVLGGELAPTHVKLELPGSWKVATGLEPTADPWVFYAPSIDVLMESPIFAGHFRDWKFEVDGVPHRVVYWPAANATPFDTVAFVRGIESFTHQAVTLFGRPPYREYTFVFQDAAYGGLEHPNMVTLGVESSDLAENANASLEETAHEFFHTWNLMRIRPEEYRSVTYQTQPPTAGLWFSEGLTIYYADLLRRRAGLPVEDSTRVQRLEGLISRYLANPGNSRFSAESISKVAYNADPGSLGDYSASAHLVGEVLGNLLDISIRDATGGEHSMDDVMRLMLERFGGPNGFDGGGVEQAVEDVCRCDVTPLFDAHVRRAGRPVDYDRYLGLLGFKSRVTWEPAVWNDQPERDLRIWGWEPRGERGVRLIISNPESIWGRAGLHSRDRLVSVNGAPVTTWPAFRTILNSLKIGDSVSFEVARAGGPYRTTVVMAGFQRPSVRIESLPNPTERQLAARAGWLKGE